MLKNPFFELPNENPLTGHFFCLPNAPSNPYYSLSHFAQKIRNQCWILKSTGHEVYYYGYETCEVECDEKIIVADEDILMEAYPRCKSEFGHIDINEEKDNPEGIEYLEKMWTLRTGHEFKKRYKPGDFVFWMLPMCGQRDLYDDLKGLPVRHVEPGIGYIGAFLPYKIFISAYVRDFHYGMYHGNNRWYQILGEKSRKERPHGSHSMHTYIDWENPPAHDAVIPNAYDLSQFDFRVEKKDYLLCLARVLQGKGIAEAVEVAERVGMKLIVAGPGDFEAAVGKKPSENIEVLGPVGPDERKDLLSHAYAILSLSGVHETLGGAAIEGMLSGTVPITANTGGFLDSIRSGYNGYRVDYRKVEQAVRAVENVHKIDPYAVRDAGLRFSREQLALRHNAYLQNIDMDFKGINRVSDTPWDWELSTEKIKWPDGWMIPIDKEACKEAS